MTTPEAPLIEDRRGQRQGTKLSLPRRVPGWRLWLLVALSFTVLGVVAAPASADPATSFIRLNGYEGVTEQVFTDENASLFRTIGSFGSPYGPPQPDLFFSLFQSTPRNTWQFTFVPPLGSPLEAGVYPDAGGFDAFPLRPVMVVLHSTDTGLFVCNGGSFTIKSISGTGSFVNFEVEWTQECGGVPVSGRAVFGPPPDTVPPFIEVPEFGRVFRLATSPNGAVVQYEAIARDSVDPTPDLVCTPPSGTVFAIGETVVTCTATDDAGNSSSATFTVFVIGAEGQLIGLLDRLASEPGAPGSSLAKKVDHALRDLQQGQTTGACRQLSEFVAQVSDLGNRLPNGAELIAIAEQIRSVLAC